MGQEIIRAVTAKSEITLLTHSEWLLDGENPGNKADNLLDFDTDPFRNATVLPGFVIGASHFLEFVELNPSICHPENFEFLSLKYPEGFLERINSLAHAAAGQPLAIRSSGSDGIDSDGTGIYHTGFAIHHDQIAMEIIKCYKSFYARKAASFRAGPVDSDHGMAILIQPVIGETYSEAVVAPLLSGVCSVENGIPLIRLDFGLGTKVVGTYQSPVFTGEQLNSATIIETLLKRSFGSINCINLETGLVVSVPVQDEMLTALVANQDKLAIFIEDWLQNGTPSLEFAITTSPESPVHILQVQAERTTKEIADSPLTEAEATQARVFLRGTDMVNYGTVRGRGIFVVNNRAGLKFLEIANEKTKDFLVIVPDALMSNFLQPPIHIDPDDWILGLHHFSNAAGVIEAQYHRVHSSNFPHGMIPQFTIDHLDGKGGTHFAHICQDKGKLYLGVSAPDDKHLRSSLGRPSEHFGRNGDLTFYDATFVWTNTEEQGGIVLLTSETRRNRYDATNLRRWADETWDKASELDKLANDIESYKPLSDAFYYLTYALADATPHPGETEDNFEFVAQYTDIEDLSNIITNLELARDNMDELDSYHYVKMARSYLDTTQKPHEDLYIDTFIDDLLPLLKDRLQELQS